MPQDALRRAVDALDRERTEKRVLDRMPRHASTKRLCVGCRRAPTYDQHRETWLKENPMPEKRVAYVSIGVPHYVDWTVETWVRFYLPKLSEVTVCPFCGGQLIEVTA